MSGAPGVALLALIFAAFALVVYAPSLSGPFLSDDIPYITGNPYVHGVSAENLRAIFDPFGPVVQLAANYSPVHLLGHAIAWEYFGEDVRRHHIVNVLLHALASALLVALFVRSGVRAGIALFGGGFFLLHPANVEAVAWISQLKTSLCLVLALGALLAHPRRPLLGTLLFGLAILAKPLAAFALPVAAARAWVRRETRAFWLWAWAAAFAALAVVEISAFRDYGMAEAPLHPDPVVWARTIVALAARYLVMAVTSLGVSSFHELPRVLAWTEPWFLAGLGALAMLGARTVFTLRARREELVFWVWAAVSFGPVSQFFPFEFSMADRYLYLILPGFFGGAALALQDPLGRLAERSKWDARVWRVAWIGAGVLVLAGFSVRSSDRAALWRSAALVGADSARNYPQGRVASLNAARAAAQRGDGPATARALQAAIQAGYDYLHVLLADTDIAPMRWHPEVDRVYRELAAARIERIRSNPKPRQAQLNMLALAHETRGEWKQAERALERALETGGFESDLVELRLDEVRRKARAASGARERGRER